MDKFKRCPILVIIFMCILPSLTFAQEKYLQEVEDVREDIVIINLLNSLDLRKEQMEFILVQAKKAQRIRSDALNKTYAYKSEMLNALGAIKQEVESGRVTVEKEEARDFINTKHQIKNIIKDTQINIDKIAQEVEAKLEPFQLIALEGYKPCIIPEMANGRIGQADTAIGITKALQRVKAVPESRYTQNKDRLIKQLLDRIKAEVPRNLPIEEKNIEAEISSTFERVRSMNDVDFQLQKTSIAKGLSNKILPEKKLMSKIDKIGKFLLQENIIPILEQRLAKK
jgi:hypothetical protein